jgi:heme/copper-type cytochrome/quinol oxidase subunit 3
MSAEALSHPVQRGPARPHERTMGEIAMWLFIATEGTLFALLFFSYVYLALSQPHWPIGEDPDYVLALILAGILILSSVTAWWGEHAIETANNTFQLKVSLGVTLFLGAAFIGVQFMEYLSDLDKLHPRDNSYGSIFYTIVSFHFMHVLVGWLMLWFAFIRSLAGHFSKERHLAVKNITNYWHFVDVIWLFVVAIVFIAPQFYGPPTQ